MKIITISLIAAILIPGCDKTIKLPIDDKDGKKIDFACGNVVITAIKSFGPGYTISQKFSLTKEVSLYFDSLKIDNKGSVLQFEITDGNAHDVKENIITFSGQNNINVHIPQNLQTGDALVVRMKGFLMCNGMSVYNDQITIVLKDHP